MLSTTCRVFVVLALVATGCAERPVQTVLANADFQFDHGNYVKAASEYEEVTNRQPGAWRAHYQLGLCLLELDKPTDARRQFEQAHTRQPRNPEVTEALAESILASGDETGLFRFLSEEARTNPSADAYLRLARFSLLLNDPDSAQTAVLRAIDIDGGATAAPYLEAANLAERIGDMETALRRIRQAYGIDPGDQRVHERLRALGEVPGPTIALPPGR